MTGRWRWALVILSGSVLLLAILASARPDLVARWTGLRTASPGPDRRGVAEVPAPSARPDRGAGAVRPGPAPDAEFEFPPVPETVRTVVHFAVDRKPSGAIEGRVTDRAARPQPGRAVSISAMQGDGERAPTDSSGRYRREGLIPGLYMVALDPVAGEESFAAAPSELVEVRRGETAVVDFLAHESGRLEGRVLRDGQPAVAAEVRLLQVPRGGTRRERAAATASDDTGTFAIEDLTPGAYRLVATHELAFRERDGVVMRGMARLDTTLEIRAGENRVEVSFAEGRLQGKVSDARTGSPLSLAMVTVVPAGPRDAETGFHERFMSLDSGTQLSDEDGSFEVAGLAPGNYRVTATLPGYWTHTGAVTVVGGRTPYAVPLQSGGGTVDVELLIPQGVFLPLLNLRVSDAQGYDVGFWAMGGNDRDHSLYERTQQRLANLAPGRHTLELEVPGQGRYSAEVEVGEDSTPRVSFVLSSGDD